MPELSRIGNGNLNGARLSGDGRTLAVVGSFGLRFHSLPDLAELRTFELEGEPYDLALSADGLAAATVSKTGLLNQKIWLVSAEGGPQGPLLELQQFVQDLALDHTGNRLAVGTLAVDLLVLDTATGAERWHERRDGATALAVSPDGRTLAAGAAGRALALMDLERGEERRVLRPYDSAVATTWIRGVAFSPDGRTLATGTGHDLELWDVATGRCTASWRAHEGHLTEVAFSHDGARLATTDYESDVATWTPLGSRLECAVPGRWRVLGFSAADDRLLLAGQRGLRAHDAASGRELARYDYWPWREVRILARSPTSADHKRPPAVWALLSRAHFEQPCLRAWSLPDGRELRRVSGPEHAFNELAFAPDFETYATVDQSRLVRLRSARDGAVLHTFLADETNVLERPCFSTDGQLLFVVGDRDTREVGGEFDQRIEALGHVAFVFDPATGRTVFRASWDEGPLEGLRTSEDGLLTLELSRSDLRLCEAATGRLLAEALRAQPLPPDLPFEVAVAPDRTLRVRRSGS